jgi:hypothetical protein
MRIRVDFTVEIDPDHLDRLRELSGNPSASVAEVRGFVQAEAQEHLLGYLDDAGGVRARTIRGPWGETQFAW